ncbi:MAG: DUF2267 domain-containing protein [Actinomycetota bacterium]|nr:DUF2267 domain-containing protein [Actinomycetota bacterium]
MQDTEFISLVQERAQLDSAGEAESVVHGVLRMLARHLSAGEAEDLAGQLPRLFHSDLAKSKQEAEGFSLTVFLQRLAEWEGVDQNDAEQHARAVLSVLQEAVTPGQLKHVLAQLPKEFEQLLAE